MTSRKVYQLFRMFNERHFSGAGRRQWKQELEKVKMLRRDFRSNVSLAFEF